MKQEEILRVYHQGPDVVVKLVSCCFKIKFNQKHLINQHFAINKKNPF
ncbi:hypothetical protein [Bacillus sp. ISL-46]|nr:hypothetical protein [Bacillus sp. ISL-46]MBT2724520.1 hypothetical protein [Bacillus sp. ISL-46]